MLAKLREWFRREPKKSNVVTHYIRGGELNAGEDTKQVVLENALGHEGEKVYISCNDVQWGDDLSQYRGTDCRKMTCDLTQIGTSCDYPSDVDKIVINNFKMGLDMSQDDIENFNKL